MIQSATVQRFPQVRVTHDEAEMLAIGALSFIADDAQRLGRFLQVSGLEHSTIRAAARTRVFLLGIFDYLATDEALLSAFANHAGSHPQTVMAARSALSPRLEPAAVEPATGSIIVQCEHCDGTDLRRRRDVPHAPRRAIRLRIPRCGPCGGGFDQHETWLDTRGREVD